MTNSHEELVLALEECLDELTTVLFDNAEASTLTEAEKEVEENPIVLKVRTLLHKEKT